MKVVVYGAGGVGGYFGTLLMEAGCDVKMLARGAHLEAMKEKGLTIRKKKPAEERNYKVDAVETADQLGGFEPDVVVVGVKMYDLEPVAAACKKFFPNAGAVPILNGVEAVEVLSDYLGASNVIAGVTRVVAYIEEPGVVTVLDTKPMVELGEWEGEPKSPRVLELCSMFNRDGLSAYPMECSKTAIWTKMIQMGSLGPLCAVTRVSIHEVTTIPETRQMFMSAMAEIIAVAEKEGVKVTIDPESTATRLAGVEAFKESNVSTARDAETGRPMEIESFSGKVIKLGAKHNIPTPTHEFLFAALLPLHLRGLQRSAKVVQS